MAKEPIRVLVTGDRNWDNENAVHEVLSSLNGIYSISVIQGGARGADTQAAIVCSRLGIPCQTMMADWEKHGRSAGPIRNRAMLKEFKPDVVVAFHANLNESKGTADMIRAARGKVRLICHHDGKRFTVL